MVAVFCNNLTSSLEVLTSDGFSKIRITRKNCVKKKQCTCLCACVYRNLVRVVSSASELAFLSSTAYVVFSVGCQITPETKVFPVSQIIIRHHIHPPSWQKQWLQTEEADMVLRHWSIASFYFFFRGDAIKWKLICEQSWRGLCLVWKSRSEVKDHHTPSEGSSQW